MDQAKLSAFVGHSFDERDKPLIDKMMRFLVSAGVENETGEPAENRSVSAKVRERIDRHPIFVGIFTHKCKLDGKELFSTSNWVIQESGYALAKGKELLLLLEEGVDNFPELQGDVEYVPFQRDKLEDPFLKLNEIIGTIRSRLSQRVQVDIAQEPPKPGKPLPFPEEERAKPRKPAEASLESLTPAQEKKACIEKMFVALMDNQDFAEGQRIFREELVKLLDEKERIYWEGVCLQYSHDIGDTSAFQRLQTLARENPTSKDAHRQLAIAFEGMRMWEEATQEFLTSAEFDTNEVTQCSAFGRAALCMFMGSKIMEAKGFIEEKLQVHTDGEAAYRLFKTLTDIAGKEEDRQSFVIYAERALEIKPSDHELRFQTAYKYSEIGCQSLSLYHYRILEAHSFDGACLNNLGVVLTELALPCKSVSSYKKSAGLKETLAMANLGYKYLQAGFVDEALERVSDALKLAGEVDVHGNVGQMKIAVGEAVDKEGKQEETLIREAEKARAFRLRFVKSLCTRPKKPLDLDGKWHWGDWETMVLKCVDGKILGSFEKRLSVNRGLLSFLPLPLGTQPQTLPPEKYKTQKAVIRGVAQNLTATIEIKVTEEEEGVLFPFSKSVLEAKAMVIFDPEGQKAELQQENSPGKISYYDAIKLVSSIEQILNDPQRM